MKSMRLIAAMLAVTTLAFGLVGCKGPEAAQKEASAHVEAEAKAETTEMVAEAPVKAKYVFMFVGDGMGLPQRAATTEFMGKKLVMDTFPAQGITTTHANDRYITGSAASATAIAAGQKTNINYIGVDPDLKPVKTIAEMARDAGMKVGIVSSVSIDHATPAAFYAHVKTRKMYHEIDHALAESGFDFFGGGGLKDTTGKKSEAPMGDAMEKAAAAGYVYANSRDAIMALKPGQKAIAVNEWLQDSGAMPYVMDMTEKDVTLPEFTSKAIELLDGDKGFFLMVEGGKIDWACHANDAAAAIRNNISFDESVRVAVEFAKKHPEETLIVVTGDHECGGLTLGFAGTKYKSYFEVLGAQKISFQQFTDTVIPAYKEQGGDLEGMKQIITDNFGLKFEGDVKQDRLVLEDHEIAALEMAFAKSMNAEGESGYGAEVKSGKEAYVLYGDYDPLAVTLTHILDNKAGLAWTSYKHTGVPVSTSAMGARAELFNGAYDNTDIALKMMDAMGFDPKVTIMASK